ncbi:MAG: hypothetical protein BAJATHORv1_90039 [Candidatus Thorarchaeota archaeon]|nr:MAG: hypothetical protein BAJATHORv1_90039 [Candidatus Thorarchaeota archaeon]
MNDTRDEFNKSKPEHTLETLEPVPLVRVLFLAFISKYPDTAGYDLIKLTNDFTEGRVEISSGTVYTELRRLEKMGYVIPGKAKGSRRRKSYEITEEGRRELANLVKQIELRVETVLKPLVKFVRSG